ncbi:hypothetical protein Thermo_01676 [Thermoplasmatales archaeon]|nr:hypothetical protein Thermo_01676 [Thermoplasmatales archaeon]
MEPAEIIVKEWLQKVMKQFTMENILYPVNSGKSGSNYSDIDIFAFDAKDRKFYDYEVKWSSGHAIGATPSQTVGNIVNRFYDDARGEIISEIGISDSRNIQKVLVAPRLYFGTKEETKKKYEQMFKENKIEVKYFEDIIKELMEYSEKSKKDDSIVVRLLRSINYSYPDKSDRYGKIQ